MVRRMLQKAELMGLITQVRIAVIAYLFISSRAIKLIYNHVTVQLKHLLLLFIFLDLPPLMHLFS